MSDTPQAPDWLGPAQDRLREVGLDDAADALARLPTVEERLERTVGFLEEGVRSTETLWISPSQARHPWWVARIALIAEHRGEVVEVTLARLGPARQPATAERGPHADLPRIDREVHMAAVARVMQQILEAVPDAVWVSRSPSDHPGTARVRRRDGGVTVVDVTETMWGDY